MKHLATAALILNLGVAYVHAQQRPVSLSFSGTIVPSAINLTPSTTDANFAGDGSLGPFTYRQIAGGSGAAAFSSTCVGPTKAFFPFTAGAGVFRFQDGSLLTVRITAGGTCIDFSVPEGIATVTYQITGGTGRFQNASGTLNTTTVAKPLLFGPAEPVIFAATGDFTGAVAF